MSGVASSGKIALKDQRAVVLPKMARVDVVFSKRNFIKNLIRMLGSTIYSHKIKTIVVILGLYAAHKTFGLYKSIRSALNPLGELQQISDEDSASAQTDPITGRAISGDRASSSQDSKALKTYIQEDPMHLLQVKIFQSSLRNVLDNLPKVISFIVKQVETHFNLQEASARAKERSETLTMPQKILNWSNLTSQLIKTIFGQMFASRIVNLTSMVQFSQSGKLFFNLERRSKSEEEPVAEDGELTEAQIQRQLTMDNLKQSMHSQSDEFIRDIYQLVIQPVIMQKVLPLVDKVTTRSLAGLTPKDKVTLTKFRQTMTAINEKILEQLFKPVSETRDDGDQPNQDGEMPSEEKVGYLVDSDEDDDIADQEIDTVYKYALATEIIAQYESQSSAFKEGTLKRELADELIDMIESEYFAGALYELCTATFESTVLSFLSDHLQKNMKPSKHSSAAMLDVQKVHLQQAAQPEEPRIAVVQLTTIFYQLQNSDLIQEHLASDIKGTIKIELKTEEVKAELPAQSKSKYRFVAYEAQLAQLIKFVFFENQKGQAISMSELMKDLTKLEQEQQSNAGIEGLFGELGGGNGEEYGNELEMIQKLFGGSLGQQAPSLTGAK